MTSKSVVLTAMAAILGFGITLLFAIQMPGMQMPATSQTDQNQKSLDVEMMNHQSEMQALLAKLEASFQAIMDAKDANGRVHGKSIVKAHEADLTELRNAVRHHKQFLIDYEGKCSVNSKQHDAMIEHQQQMKAVLFDVVDTFYTYMDANDSTIVASEPVEDALTALREALKELGNAIAQHKQAMAQIIPAIPKPTGHHQRDSLSKTAAIGMER